MSERPILFSSEMVRAILAGRKTQTRRILRPQPHVTRLAGHDIPLWGPGKHASTSLQAKWLLCCPYGRPGSHLWVRETWLELDDDHRDRRGVRQAVYRADTTSDGDDIRRQYGYRWRPSIHMPRWASRLTLEVTSTRVERLQEITEEDARAEGVEAHLHDGYDGTIDRERPARSNFERLWDHINGERAPWATNPWVFVVGFRSLP